MIRRIVKMTFREEACPSFVALFEAKKAAIRAFPGCEHLELWRGVGAQDSLFMTYSHWRSDADLQAYRNSSLFKETWAQTKILFSDKPEAWSLNIL